MSSLRVEMAQRILWQEAKLTGLAKEPAWVLGSHSSGCPMSIKAGHGFPVLHVTDDEG
jgi:hypothetical protein